MVFVWLPTAIKNDHGGRLPWATTKHPKGMLHTTEGTGWTNYGGWTIPPHGTIMPTPGKGVTIRQHIPLSSAAFSLRNLPGGVQTNREMVFQWELIGTSEKGGPGYYWPDADDAVLKDLHRKLILPLSREYGIPIRALPFQAYPASYGARGKTNTVRLSGPAWDTYSGWLGHQHCPENIHGDPGAFPWDRMIRLSAADTGRHKQEPVSAATRARAAAALAVRRAREAATAASAAVLAGSRARAAAAAALAAAAVATAAAAALTSPTPAPPRPTPSATATTRPAPSPTAIPTATPTPTTPRHPTVTLRRTLRYTPGHLMNGPDVRSLQALVGLTGHSRDGFFGPVTAKAVTTYQRAHHFTPDGVAGQVFATRVGWAWLPR